MSGPADDQRNAQSGIVQPALAAQVATTVVPDEDDNCVVGKIFCIQSLQNFPALGIHVFDSIEIPRPIQAAIGMVGKVGRQDDGL